jgi:hypothetical protein
MASPMSLRYSGVIAPHSPTYGMASVAASASTITRLRSTVMRSHISWIGSPAARTPAASLKSLSFVSTRCPSTSKWPSSRL